MNCVLHPELMTMAYELLCTPIKAISSHIAISVLNIAKIVLPLILLYFGNEHF